jgi:hypothetical protein
MRVVVAFCMRFLLRAGLVGVAWPCLAAEGTTAAGPIGGTDIRSAILPPPGVYGGVIGLNSHVPVVVDGTGHPAPGLDAVDLTARVAAPFVVFVPDVKVAGGTVGLIGVFPGGQECGQLVSAFPMRCTWGMGDPYLELAWSRYFGTARPSQFPNALPIPEGLVLGAGLGVVIPGGKFEPQLRATNGPSLGNNIWDVAPSLAVTYTRRRRSSRAPSSAPSSIGTTTVSIGSRTTRPRGCSTSTLRSPSTLDDFRRGSPASTRSRPDRTGNSA